MTILVTGATGGVGRLVVDELIALGADDIRAVTVNPRRAALPDGVEVAVGNIARPETLVPALTGVDALYLAPLAGTTEAVVRLAEAAGVRRIVDLSGAPDTEWTEVAATVERGSIPWTHLWPWEFMENTAMWAGMIRETGRVRDAHPAAGNAPIAMREIAAVAAIALTRDGHEGLAHALTGPECLTRRERVRLLGVALDRGIPYVELSEAEAITEYQPVLGEYAAWYWNLTGELVTTPQQPLSTVADILDRPPTTFLDWARANHALFT